MTHMRNGYAIGTQYQSLHDSYEFYFGKPPMTVFVNSLPSGNWSHVSVRSYFFRELIADNSDAAIREFKLNDYRIFWRWANNKAKAWSRKNVTH